MTPQEAMDARPVDPRMGVLIPWVSEFDDGRHDFTGINAKRQYECANGRLCAICGTALGYWQAFIGGPSAMENRTFSDPAMHPECAEAAVRLCPHLAIARHRRASAKRQEGKDLAVPPGFVEEKPSEFFIGITRGYELMLVGGHIVFLPKPWKEVRRHEFAA